ncbi:hypothetical protein BDN72DRAFT_836874 [Pluteus cervinus]|uniref:Uncharacterized protein n=1 Tax=Pluteus cervinus TaxID=181527 RepID=A0ACD3B2V1_9AGAR|nr:hypothetical protein BDN72DRAFT_836874 [Pluteus cervinus]
MTWHYQNYTRLVSAGARRLLPHHGIWYSPDAKWNVLVADEAGRSLQDYGPWNLDSAVKAKFIGALQDIHSAGFCHGAITRSNLYVRFAEGGCHAFILGFQHIRDISEFPVDHGPTKLAKDIERATLNMILDEKPPPVKPARLPWYATNFRQYAQRLALSRDEEGVGGQDSEVGGQAGDNIVNVDAGGASHDGDDNDGDNDGDNEGHHDGDEGDEDEDEDKEMLLD